MTFTLGNGGHFKGKLINVISNVLIDNIFTNELNVSVEKGILFICLYMYHVIMSYKMLVSFILKMYTFDVQSWTTLKQD